MLLESSQAPSANEPYEVAWDYGFWHWPEVGVELTTTDGSRFFAIWDSKVTNFELTFGRGPISQEWLPLQESPPSARAWDVTAHPRWSVIVGQPVARYSLAFVETDDPSVRAPVAIRVATGQGLVWLVVAGPLDPAIATNDFEGGVYLGHDEVIVVFDDAQARRIGLVAAP